MEGYILQTDFDHPAFHGRAKQASIDFSTTSFVKEVSRARPLLKEKLLSSGWTQLLQPYTLTEQFLYSTKRQIKAFKYHLKRRFHLGSTCSQKSANLLGHSSGLKTG